MRSAIWLSICVAISALLLGAGNAKVGVVFSSGYDETDFFDYNIQYPASWSLVAQDDTTAIPKTVTVGADGGGVITTVTSSGIELRLVVRRSGAGHHERPALPGTELGLLVLHGEPRHSLSIGWQPGCGGYGFGSFRFGDWLRREPDGQFHWRELVLRHLR